MTFKKHITENKGSYAGILAVFPIIFAVNLAMPDKMRFATNTEVNNLRCETANLMEELAGGNVARYTKEAGENPSIAEEVRISKSQRNLTRSTERQDEFC